MKTLLCILFLILSSTLFAKGGDEVRNGGGLAEQFLAYTLNNMPRIVDRCLAQHDCQLELKEREVLKKIRDSLETELNSNILKFSTNILMPGYFIIDGVVRLAVTGDKVGSPIYYNLEMLYSNQNEVQLNYGQAIQSLIHELGHHHGINNHDMLERLGAKIRKVNEGKTSVVPFYPHLGGKGFSILGTADRSYTINGMLLLLVHNGLINLQMHFGGLLKNCEKELGANPLNTSAVQFYNLHWKFNAENYLTKDKFLAGNVFLYCSDGQKKKYRKLYEFTLSLKIEFKNGKFYYITSGFEDGPRYILTQNTNVLRDI
jgi:predicted Zn-dependent protease with MMP-like domain